MSAAQTPWNWCPKCKDTVDDDMRTGEFRDGSEGTCRGCGTVYVGPAEQRGWHAVVRAVDASRPAPLTANVCRLLAEIDDDVAADRYADEHAPGHLDKWADNYADAHDYCRTEYVTTREQAILSALRDAVSRGEIRPAPLTEEGARAFATWALGPLHFDGNANTRNVAIACAASAIYRASRGDILAEVLPAKTPWLATEAQKAEEALVFYRGDRVSHIQKTAGKAWCGMDLTRLDPEPDRSLDGRACRRCRARMEAAEVRAASATPNLPREYVTQAGCATCGNAPGERHAVNCHGMAWTPTPGARVRTAERLTANLPEGDRRANAPGLIVSATTDPRVWEVDHGDGTSAHYEAGELAPASGADR